MSEAVRPSVRGRRVSICTSGCVRLSVLELVAELRVHSGTSGLRGSV